MYYPLYCMFMFLAMNIVIMFYAIKVGVGVGELDEWQCGS